MATMMAIMMQNKMTKTNKDLFHFDPLTHTYTYDGVKMTGVTTVLGMIAKPALIPWAANMACDYIKNNAPLVKEGRKHVYQVTNELIDEARKAHQRKKEARGAEGTDIHTQLENIIDEAIEFSDGYIQRPLPIKELPKQVLNFIDWSIDNKVKYLVSEQVMCHPEWFVGGTADFTCMISNKRYVGDFKTQKKIWDRVPFFQMAAYRGMLERMGEAVYQGAIILHIPSDDEVLEAHYSYDYESDLSGFTSALTLYRLLNNY